MAPPLGGARGLFSAVHRPGADAKTSLVRDEMPRTRHSRALHGSRDNAVTLNRAEIDQKYAARQRTRFGLLIADWGSLLGSAKRHEPRVGKEQIMRHLGLFLLGSLALAACASNNTPPAASSGTVAQATNEPNYGPDFAPASSDGLATAPAEKRRAANATQPAPSLDVAKDERGSVADPTNANAAATPADRTDRPAPVNPAPAKTDADNSRVNQRDRNSATLTPMDQGSSASDRNITQQIRKDLMKDSSLSFTAKNVKIITIDGKVTLRGPVKSEAERSTIEAAARRAAGDGARVDSQLEVSK